MKTVVNISLGLSDHDYEFETEFLGERFRVIRFGTNGNTSVASKLVQQWAEKADAISLGMIREHYVVGTRRFIQKGTERLEKMSPGIPLTTGSRLRRILQRWGIRHVQNELGDFFNNARVLFFSGMANYQVASALSEFTPNLSFADPILQLGIPKLLTSLRGLELYTMGTHEVLKWVPSKVMFPSVALIKEWNTFLLRKSMRKATVIVAPPYQLAKYSLEELAGKTILTSAVTDDALEALKDKGVNLVIDGSPNVLERAVGIQVIDAMIMAASGKNANEITDDDYLNIVKKYDMRPRILYPSKNFRRVHRFAFVIHPLSQEFLKSAKPLEIISNVAPSSFMKVVEKTMAHSPPLLYSKVKGIKSPTGVEAEGWLITIGGTPREILSHPPEFTYRRLLAAGEMAQKLGAQIMGLGAFTKVVGDAGVTVARRSVIPVTSGNSYTVSATLWSIKEAVRRLGLVKLEKGKKIPGKAMVIGATGSIGSVCSRILAKVYEEVHLVSIEPDKLLSLQEQIQRDDPGTKIHTSIETGEELKDIDVIVTATSGVGKKILDIMKVKPGCIIADVARPLDLPASEVEKRPDVLVIESGEIKVPGELKIKNIGLPANVVYACLAETIVLALEGRYETFTIGRNIEWEKVKEIYELGLKHGMQLAAISGVNGIFSDEDFNTIRNNALEARRLMDSV